MTPGRLKEIRARMKGVSPGPWFVNPRTEKICHGDPDDDRDNYPVFERVEDDDFVIAARQDVPDLCDALEEAWRMIEVMKTDRDAYQQGLTDGKAEARKEITATFRQGFKAGQYDIHRKF